MRVIIVGCGRIGSTLADQMYKKEHHVTVIDQNGSAFDNLPGDFQGRMIEGDVLVKNVLQRAEIEHANALAAVTRSDSLNAVIAHIARTEHHVPKVVVRNYDPRQRALQETFNVPIVGSAGWRVQRIEELLSDDEFLHVVYSDSIAKFGVYQLRVTDTWHGCSIQELFPDNERKILALTRDDQSIPLPYTQTLKSGDLIHLSANSEEIAGLRNRLNVREEKKV
jgi:trk system potassium uptake protein